MTRELTDLEFVRAAAMAERIAGAGNAGYWLQCSGVNADHQGRTILDGIRELAALHGLVLVEADTHAADAALAGINSVQP